MVQKRVVHRKEDVCNYFQDAAISWRFAIFFNIEKAAGNSDGSIGHFATSWSVLLCKRKKRCSHFLHCPAFSLFATLRRQLAKYSRLFWSLLTSWFALLCRRKKKMQPFSGHNHFLEGYHLLFLQHWEGNWQILWVSVSNFSTSWCALLFKRKKRCIHFREGYHFLYFYHWEGSRQITWVSISHFATSWFTLLFKRKKMETIDAASSRTQPFPGGIPFFLSATFRRQLGNYMGLY